MNSLSIAIPMQKKLHWFNDSISVFSLSMNILEIWLTHSIYDTTLPKFFRSGLTFHEALLTCKISGWLTSSLLRYSWFFSEFCNLVAHPTTNFQITFYLPSIYISIHNNHDDWLNRPWDMARLYILQFDRLRAKFRNHLLRFLNIYLYANNQVDLSNLTWNIVEYSSTFWLAQSIFNLTQVKIYKPSLCFLNL